MDLSAEQAAMLKQPHRRYNALKDEWVLVSPHRTQRPWQGQVESTAKTDLPQYDPTCYLCPGNHRAGGVTNPQYASIYVFQNDYPALLTDTPEAGLDIGGLLQAHSERGTARVVCFSPRHDLTMAKMSRAEIELVVNAWAQQYDELGAMSFINHVQIFENRGAMMGASNPHPHGQIWAQEHIPNEPAHELVAQARYFEQHGQSLLSDYVKLELEQQSRIVVQNDSWLAVIPFWAVWPFETLVISRVQVGTISELDTHQRQQLAALLQELTRRYDALFATSFPYSMGWHQTPTDGQTHPGMHLHAHFYPPLLRSATIRKFMVGYELLGEPQRDLTPEDCAARLREVLSA